MRDQDTTPRPDTGMGGAGSGGDSATGTGAPPGAGGSGGQPIEPAASSSKSPKSQGLPAGGAQSPDPTGDVTGSPRVGAAGAREDSEAGTSAEEKVPDTHDTVSKVNESIIGSIVGDREPGDAPPPSRPTQQDKESQ